MIKHEVTFTFPTKANLDEFMAWMSDGGGEYMFMEGQTQDFPPITRFDYAKAYNAWGKDKGAAKVVNCISDPDDE
jgi:hypothetical protein